MGRLYSRSFGRPALLAVFLLLGFGCGTDGTTGAENEPAVADDDPTDVAWLRDHAAAISISPDDDDFSDLAALGQAIASARLVMLGEESHGDGTTFLAKTRLIEYLHQELGFDVLAFESGFYDVRKAWAMLQAGEPAVSAMPRGVFGVWMRSAQLEPLVQYVGTASTTANPLELAGFDCQFSASASRDFFVDDLEAFLVSEGSTTTQEPWWHAFTAELQGLVDIVWFTEKPGQADYEAFQGRVSDLRTEVGGFQSSAEVAFWKQMLKSLEQDAEYIYYDAPDEWDPAVLSIRDEQMGDNLVWLMQEGFPGRKVIVWAATFHIARRLDELAWEFESQYDGYTTMGDVVWQRLGTEAYAIGFTAAEGEAGWWSEEPHPLDPPRKASLEAAFVEAGFDNAFLDLRNPPAGGDWLQDWIWSRPLAYANMRAAWPNHLDAMVFTRTMEPSTASAAASDGST